MAYLLLEIQQKSLYDEMIRLVTKAEKYLKSEKQKKLSPIKSKKTPFGPDTIAPIIRGLLSKSANYVLNFRSNNQLMDIIDLGMQENSFERCCDARSRNQN